MSCALRHLMMLWRPSFNGMCVTPATVFSKPDIDFTDDIRGQRFLTFLVAIAIGNTLEENTS